jgi:gluconate 5-dehydrogenase
MTLFDLTGRTALVTGSSRGLGLSFAEGLGAAGAALVLNGIDRERLSRTADALRNKGLDVREAPFDVCDEAAVTAAFEQFDSDGVAVDIRIGSRCWSFRLRIGGASSKPT